MFRNDLTGRSPLRRFNEGLAATKKPLLALFERGSLSKKFGFFPRQKTAPATETLNMLFNQKQGDF